MSSRVVEGLEPFKDEQGYVYVTVDLKKLNTHTIHGLAKELRLSEDAVFESLVSNVLNSDAVKGLYDHARSSHGGPEFGDIGVQLARIRLWNLWRPPRPSPLHLDRSGNWTQRYEIGGMPVPSDGKYVFPLSEALYCSEPAGLHQPSKTRRRGNHFECVTPSDALDRHLNELKTHADELHKLTARYQQYAKAATGDIANLMMARSVIDVLINEAPREGRLTSDVDRAQKHMPSMRALGEAVDVLQEIARKALVDEPILYNITRIVIWRAEDVVEVLNREEFMELIANMVEDPSAFTSRHLTALEVIESAYTGLLLSPIAQNIIDEHVVPLIEVLASHSMEPFEFPAREDEGSATDDSKEFFKRLQDAANTQVELRKGKTPTSVLASMGKLVKEVIGTGPGPASLVGAVLEIAAPLIMMNVSGSAVQSGRFAGQLFRSTVWMAQPDPQVRASMTKVVVARGMRPAELQAMRGKWDRGLGGGRYTSAIFTIISVINGLAAIQDLREDDSGTKELLKAFGACAGIALSGAKYIPYSWQRALGKVPLRAAKRFFGCVGSAVAMVNGAMLFVESMEAGDRGRMVEGGAEAGGGAAQLIGFSLFLGAASTSAATVGAGLMVVGAGVGVVLIGADLYRFARESRSRRSRRLFEHFLGAFEESDSVKIYPGEAKAFSVSNQGAEERLGLFQCALKVVHEAKSEARFWYVNHSHDAIDRLRELEFSDDGIHALT